MTLNLTREKGIEDIEYSTTLFQEMLYYTGEYIRSQM